MPKMFAVSCAAGQMNMGATTLSQAPSHNVVNMPHSLNFMGFILNSLQGSTNRMAFKPSKWQQNTLNRTRRAQGWVPCSKAPIAIAADTLAYLCLMLCEVVPTGLSSGNSHGSSPPSSTTYMLFLPTAHFQSLRSSLPPSIPILSSRTLW